MASQPLAALGPASVPLQQSPMHHEAERCRAGLQRSAGSDILTASPNLSAWQTIFTGGTPTTPSAAAVAASRLSAETEKAHLVFFSRSTATRAHPFVRRNAETTCLFFETPDAKRLERFQFAALKLSER
jgi:hypothetical protein